MRTQKLEWSDIPFVLSVCETGSLSGAARALDVNHSTVFRRIEAVEIRLGVRLFDRQRHGYVMTPAGELFHQRAKELRKGMDGIELALGGRDLRLEGRLTVTTTDSLLHCLSPVFSTFQKSHPDVELRLLSETRALDLSRRDADIALRPTLNPPEHWIGRKLSKVCFATYIASSHEAIADRRSDQPIRWIMLDDDLDQSPMSKITSINKPARTPVTVASTVMGVFDAVRAGLGQAVLPCYIGDADPELLRIQEPDHDTVWDLWLLAHPDVRRSARVHAFFEYATKSVSEVMRKFEPPISG